MFSNDIFSGGWFSNLKHKIVGESVIDENAEQHKEQFTALVREIRNAFRHDGLLLTLSVLPNVNSSGKYTYIWNTIHCGLYMCR